MRGRIATSRVESPGRWDLDPVVCSDPDVLGGEWCVGGTRIPTAAIRRFAEAGYTVDRIVAEYPALRARDVDCALEFEGWGGGNIEGWRD